LGVWLAKSIEIYVLNNDTYIFHGTYYKYEDYEIQEIEKEKEYFCESCIGFKEIITDFSPPSFPDLTLNVNDIFADLME